MHLGSPSSAGTLSLMFLVGLGVVSRGRVHDACSNRKVAAPKFHFLPVSKNTHSFAWKPGAGWWWR